MCKPETWHQNQYFYDGKTEGRLVLVGKAQKQQFSQGFM